MLQFIGLVIQIASTPLRAADWPLMYSSNPNWLCYRFKPFQVENLAS